MPAARIHEVIALKVNQDYNYDNTLLRLGTISPDSWRNSEKLKNNNGKNITHFRNPDVIEGESNDYDRFFDKYKNGVSNNAITISTADIVVAIFSIVGIS